MVMSKGSLSGVVAETMETERRVVKLREKAENLAGRGHKRRRQKVVSEISCLLSERSLSKWPSFVEKMCRRDGVMAEDLYSISTVESLHNLHLRVPNPSKTCFNQLLSSNEMFSLRRGRPGKQKKG